jgi:hypothetical protein
MGTFFSDHFAVDAKLVDDFGAFNISLITDLPLFIDPFLLFNSKKSEYQALHTEIIRYLIFLRDKAAKGVVDPNLLRAWYCFPEIKQTWLGFSETGNDGRGLGIDFATALHGSLHQLFTEFGKEKITKGSHLEKVCLIKSGVGRDNISDFTTNLIKDYLFSYTQRFATAHLKSNQTRPISIRSVRFNYETETWESQLFTLPWSGTDHVVLTPKDMLTRDENWINRSDLLKGFEELPASIPDPQLRMQVDNYFQKVLVRHKDREPNKMERDDAAARTILQFPQVIDYYIREKEKGGAQAASISAEKVRYSEVIFNAQVRALQKMLEAQSEFYETPFTSYEEAHQRLSYLKDVIENKGGHRLFYKDGKAIQYEKDLQIMYRLVWFGTAQDVSAEINDGRGPADFKISKGAKDKTIVEMKLAKNTSLERNLAKQTEVYQAASDAKKAIKVIVFFDKSEELKVHRILKKLKLSDSRDVVLIDARLDNKPSGSKA